MVTAAAVATAAWGPCFVMRMARGACSSSAASHNGMKFCNRIGIGRFR